MAPKKIKVEDKKILFILWDNKTESRIPLGKLRKNCPCANCVTDRQKRPENYIPLLSNAQLTLKEIKIVGSYAIQPVWQDGHDEGIYGYEFLLELSGKKL
ncbi:MAG: DUF971 domain-containing protein [Ignavibacteria bacterium]